MEHALERAHLTRSEAPGRTGNPDPRQILGGTGPLEEILGTSRQIQEVRSLITKVAPSDTAVLIQGESGLERSWSRGQYTR